MVRIALYLALGLLLGVGAERWIFSAEPRAGIGSGAGPGAKWGEFANGTLESRLAALETAMTRESLAREDLTGRFEELAAQFGNVSGPDTGSANPESGPRTDNDVPRSGGASAEMRIQRLTEAGLDPSVAERMLAREAQLRVQSLEEEYARVAEQLESGESSSFGGSGSSTGNTLREEFGDDFYDRYLFASGQGNRTRIFDVIPGSPAATAGMHAGDILMSYDGQNVFTVSDLWRAQHDGARGEDVVIEVLRDGQPVQVYVPRGPLGVRAARRTRVAPDGT